MKESSNDGGCSRGTGEFPALAERHLVITIITLVRFACDIVVDDYLDEPTVLIAVPG